MAERLPCDCHPRYITRINGPARCSVCGCAPVQYTPASARHQMDVDYACPITGKPIRSRRAHEENLRLHGCHVLEAGEKEDAARRGREADAECDAHLDATIDSVIDSMSEDKKNQLIQELSTTLPEA